MYFVKNIYIKLNDNLLNNQWSYMNKYVLKNLRSLTFKY